MDEWPRNTRLKWYQVYLINEFLVGRVHGCHLFKQPMQFRQLKVSRAKKLTIRG